MSDMLRVVFRGKLSPGSEEEEVKNNLARLFKQEPARMEKFFQGRAVVVASDLDQAAAEKYAARFKKAGAVLDIEPMPGGEEESPSKEPSPAASSVSCPQCGAGLKAKAELAGKKVKCPSCGNGFTLPGPAPQTAASNPKPAAPPAPPPPIPNPDPPPSPPADAAPPPPPPAGLPINTRGSASSSEDDEVVMGKKTRVEDLTSQARNVLEKKKLSGARRLKDWFKALKELAAFDQLAEARRRRATNFSVLFGILVVAGVFGTGFAAEQIPYLAVGLGVLTLACLVMFIINMVKRYKLGKIDLENDFRLVLIPFLQIMAEDIRPKDKINLELDMAGPTKEKITKKGRIPPGRFKKVIETIYQDPWLKAEIPLIEGSLLILEITSVYTSHLRKWTSRRGGKVKFKSKTKWKKQVEATVALIPNNRVLAFESNAEADLYGEKFKLSEKKDRQVARLTRKFKFKAVEAVPGESVDPEELVGMVMQLGRTLTSV